MYDLSYMLVESRPFVVIDGLPGLYGLKYDSAIACGLPLYLCSYKLDGSATLTGVEAHPPALMVDNQPTIALAKNPVLHNRSKHIDVKFHFLRDYVDEGHIVIEFIETGRQLADVLTKPLGRLRLTELKEMIGMKGVQGLAVGLWEDC